MSLIPQAESFLRLKVSQGWNCLSTLRLKVSQGWNCLSWKCLTAESVFWSQGCKFLTVETVSGLKVSSRRECSPFTLGWIFFEETFFLTRDKSFMYIIQQGFQIGVLQKIGICRYTLHRLELCSENFKIQLLSYPYHNVFLRWWVFLGTFVNSLLTKLALIAHYLFTIMNHQRISTF